MANTNFEAEFGTQETPQFQADGMGQENVSTDLPEGSTAEAPAQRETYTLADGSEGSRAAFIREKFIDENMSRKQISEEFGFPYRVVYSATVNMTNDAEAPSRGRSATNSIIKVNAENQFVEVKDVDGQELTFVNGEAVDTTYADEDLQDKNRNEWIKEMVDNGMSRGDIAKILGLSYGVIYGLTKDSENTRQTHTITLEDGTEISRAEYIRRRVAEGVSRSDVAKELDVPYSVVWQATKTEKTDEDKFRAALEVIESYVDQLDNKEAAEEAITILQASNFIEVADETKTEEADAE
ncbi:MAG: hypothetical protein SOT58_07445 [Agathobacter sp.]|nr:hypothetical protein [Agathobacter sp.]